MQLILHTSLGDVHITLHHKETPKTAENFMRYAKEGHFQDTVFHRVIPGFVVQGGGLLSSMEAKPTHPPVENEAALGKKNTRGSLSMARTMDPHSASSQFFINLKDNDFLDHKAPTPQQMGYCVFGHVTEGMDVVDAMAKQPTTSRAGHDDVPVEDIVVTHVTVL